MNKLILAAAASLLVANLALAQTAAPAAAGKKAPSEKQVRQQERMKACNKEAGDKKLKGAARKAFMGDCLKAGDPAGAKAAAPATPATPAQPATPAKPAGKQ